VIYRRAAGLRWILQMLGDTPAVEDFNNADGLDCLKLELVSKRELEKADLAMLKAAGFKPAGKGVVWPQFRSADPGWHPWPHQPGRSRTTARRSSALDRVLQNV